MTGVMMYFGGDDAPDYSPDYAPYASSAQFNKDILLAEVGLLGDGVRISEDGPHCLPDLSPQSFRSQRAAVAPVCLTLLKACRVRRFDPTPG
jgi:hypothetical protein